MCVSRTVLLRLLVKWSSSDRKTRPNIRPFECIFRFQDRYFVALFRLLSYKYIFRLDRLLFHFPWCFSFFFFFFFLENWLTPPATWDVACRSIGSWWWWDENNNNPVGRFLRVSWIRSVSQSAFVICMKYMWPPRPPKFFKRGRSQSNVRMYISSSL